MGSFCVTRERTKNTRSFNHYVRSLSRKINQTDTDMDEVQTKSTSTGMDDESAHDHFSHLKRLKEGYASIVDKHGYGKFKPYLQRLFQSVEKILMQEVTEFKKIDAKYQDMVRQCHIYEKTLAMLKENNPCELSTFSESSNTYAFEDFTKVTPYLAPDLLQSTLGNGGAGSTSIQFRLPRRRSSLSSRQYVSTPLGPARTNKPAVPLAHFDDESSLVLTNSLGFPQQPPPPAQEKQFVDASTSPEPIPSIEQHDFSCQTAPTYADKDIETCPLLVEFQSTQTDLVATETVACQFNPTSSDCSMQTAASEQHDFACQFYPHTVDQTTETLRTDHQTQDSQTDATPSTECACQVTPDCADQGVETTPVLTQDIALQSSFDSAPVCDNQQIQTDSVAQTDACTQYEPEVEQPSTTIIPVVFSEELPVSHEIEISHSKVFADQECQTLNSTFIQSNECTQTPHLYFNDCASQSTIVSYTHCNMQTEPDSSLYSSSVYIAPTVTLPPSCSSTVLIVPKEVYSPATLVDVEVQCDLGAQETSIAVEVELPIRNADRRSIIQHQMDEKEKQMNRIIEEYAMLYGEFESERRRNMDLTEARDRLADHIKVLSDELGDREINEEKLLIKSCQQSKLINYMLPQIDCSPVPKKKHNSASSFRRLLPKFK